MTTTQTTTLTITDLVNGSNNDMFRKGCETDSSYIFDNQINAAKEIVSAFNEKVTRRNHVMLIAKMQSGKTGTCNAVCNIVNTLGLSHVMGVDKFFFVTGMNDCGLKTQSHIRLIEQVEDANVGNTCIGKRSYNHLIKEGKNPKYYVLKNSDLMSMEDDLNNSIIFIDECHYGSGANNILTKFLYSKGINWKDENYLISRNIYIVSVSATPFSELISDEGEYKKCIELKTNDGYVGVSDYTEQGLIHNGKFEDTISEITYALADAMERMEQDGVSGVCFVRTRNFDELEDDMFVSHNFDIHEMYSSGKKIEYDRLTERVNELIAANEYNKKFKDCKSLVVKSQKIDVKPLLVLIKGAYRAGVTLDSKIKDYTYMVYDYSAKSAATAQALLGRMCGYRADGTELKTHFYINDKMATMYSNWEKDFSNRDNIPCDKMKQNWLEANEYDGQGYLSSKSCGNFFIELTDEEIETIHRQCKGKKVSRANAKRLFPLILQNHGVDCKYDYFHEAHMSGRNNYSPSSVVRRFDSFTEDSLVFGFRADKMVDFVAETGRDYLTDEDFGKRCVSIVLDADIDKNSSKVIGGNKRLLVYYSEVGAYTMIPSKESMYRAHQDTSI